MSEQYLTVNHLNTKHLRRIFPKIQRRNDLIHAGTPCWEWTGHVNSSGYATFLYQGRLEQLHRLMYAWLVEPIPRGRQNGEIDHLCRNRKCCNPLHLEHVPTRVNVLRGESPAAKMAKRTHCCRGHEYTPENTKIIATGARQCQKCLKQGFIDRSEQRKKALDKYWNKVKSDPALYQAYRDRSNAVMREWKKRRKLAQQ